MFANQQRKLSTKMSSHGDGVCASGGGDLNGCCLDDIGYEGVTNVTEAYWGNQMKKAILLSFTLLTVAVIPALTETRPVRLKGSWPPQIEIHEKDGFLCITEGDFIGGLPFHRHINQPLQEHKPSLFFTPSGIALDFTGEIPTWGNFQFVKQ
jgi:hypothetical protein